MALTYAYCSCPAMGSTFSGSSQIRSVEVNLTPLGTPALARLSGHAAATTFSDRHPPARSADSITGPKRVADELRARGQPGSNASWPCTPVGEPFTKIDAASADVRAESPQAKPIAAIKSILELPSRDTGSILGLALGVSQTYS